MKMTHALLFACGLALVCAPAAWAQGPDEPARFFVSAGGGFRYSSQSTTESGTFTLYDETGSFSGGRKVGNVVFFDVGAGMHMSGNLSIGVALTRFQKANEVQYTALVPHPLFTGAARTVGMTVKDMKHTETAIHLQAIYQLISSGRIEANLFAGPSVVMVKEDTLDAVAATETSSPYTAVNLAGTFGKASKTAFGANVGMDIGYRLMGSLGAGFMVRYTVGSAKLPSAGSTRSVKLGGPQVGVVLKYRF